MNTHVLRHKRSTSGPLPIDAMVFCESAFRDPSQGSIWVGTSASPNRRLISPILLTSLLITKLDLKAWIVRSAIRNNPHPDIFEFASLSCV